MIFHKKITLLIPCRNEEVALASLLSKTPKYIDEIIVVDNKSTDNTAKIAKKLGAKVITEKRTVNGVGYGFAHQTGLMNATGEYIVAMDGDDTYPVKSIKKIVSFMETQNLGFVSCNRLPLSDSRTIGSINKIGIAVLNILIWLLFGYHFQDILTGMWVVRKDMAIRLNLKSGDWDFSPEIKLAAFTNNKFKSSEYHIPYYLRKGESKLAIWRTGIRHLLFIIKYWLNSFSLNLNFVLKWAKSININ